MARRPRDQRPGRCRSAAFVSRAVEWQGVRRPGRPRRTRGPSRRDLRPGTRPARRVRRGTALGQRLRSVPGAGSASALPRRCVRRRRRSPPAPVRPGSGTGPDPGRRVLTLAERAVGVAASAAVGNRAWNAGVAVVSAVNRWTSRRGRNQRSRREQAPPRSDRDRCAAYRIPLEVRDRVDGAPGAIPPPGKPGARAPHLLNPQLARRCRRRLRHPQFMPPGPAPCVPSWRSRAGGFTAVARSGTAGAWTGPPGSGRGSGC